MIADRGARAVARHRRPAGGGADQAPEAAVGGILVRHRHARARRLQPRASTARACRSSSGIAVALFSTLLGLAIGLVTGFIRWLDAIVMRVMDGLMSIPSVLLAIALMALTQREHRQRDRRDHARRSAARRAPRAQPRADAARAALRRGGDRRGTTLPRILCATSCRTSWRRCWCRAPTSARSAMITEAILSFIGAGTPPNIPSWGNIMAEGRSLFQIAGYLILFPGIFLSLTVLAVNLLGDGMRDALDPRLARRM